MPYIVLHGLGQSPESWDKTLGSMSGHGDIICPDLFAMFHGEDITYANLYHTFSKYCMGFSEPVNLCGLSLGGILALQYATEYPSNVNSLVLIGTQYVMPKALLHIQNVIFHFMPKSMFFQMGFKKKDFIKLSKSMAHLDFSRELKKISCPVLVICGEKDIANKKAAKELSERLPHAKLQMIENAGHEVNVDAPEELAKVVNLFLFPHDLSNH